MRRFFARSAPSATPIRLISSRAKLVVSCAAAAVAMSTAPQAPAALLYQTVALTGTDGTYGPGEGAGVTFFSLTQVQAAINTTGQVAFRGQDSTTGNPNGLWLRTGAANAVVAINGGAQPGGGTYPTGAAASFNTILLNNSGETAWRLGSGSGAFSTSGGSAGRFILAGDSAPGTTISGPLATFSGISSGMPLLNQSGQMAVMANLTVNAALNPPVTTTSGIVNSSGIWTGTPGNAQLALRQNDTLSTLDGTGNTRLGTMQNLGFVFNGNSRYAIVSALQGSNVITGTGINSNSQIIATNRSGSFDAAARTGSAAPDAAGAPTSNLYRSISNSAPGFNDLGHLTFSSSLRDAAGTQTNAGALFTDAGTGTMRMVAKALDAMPTIYSRTGSPLSEFSGVTWGSIYGTTLLNSADQLFVAASGWGNTGGSSNTSGLLHLDTSGNWHKVVRNGDVAIVAGAPGGTDAFFATPSNVQVNSAGQVAFTSSLTGIGVSGGAGNAASLWVSDIDGTLLKIARASDMFEVAPGDIRQISAIGGLATSGGQDGRQINLSDNGLLAFQLDFIGGTSGVFTVAVPEPSFAFTALASVITIVARRRRGTTSR